MMRPRERKFMLRVCARRASNALRVDRPIVSYTHRVPPQGPALLDGLAEVRLWEHDRSPTRAEVIAFAHDADVLCYFVPDWIDSALLDALPRVRLLAGFGKGYDNVDVAAATARGILVTNVAHALTDATADLAWALLLALARRVIPGDRAVRDAPDIGWQANALLGHPVSGATLGLYGFGLLGRAIAARAAGFRMRVLAFDPASETAESPGVQRVDAATLLAESEVLVLAVPLTDSTYHLIDEQTLSRLRPGALLINPARGSVVDEDAVARALARGTLAGYAADVFEHEDRRYGDRPAALARPLVDDRVRTVFTPHAGTAVGVDRVRLAVAQADAVRSVLTGVRPAAAVNVPAVKDGFDPLCGERAQRRQP